MAFPRDTPLERVLGRLPDARPCGAGYKARCPGHEDQHPSLSIIEAPDGRVLLKCHAGCDLDTVLAGLGLTRRDLRSDPDLGGNPPARTTDPVIARYVYRDETGRPVGRVCRTEGKRFFQERSDGRGGWATGLGGTVLPLYRLPELLAVNPAEFRFVFVVEGEKDVEALTTLGLVVTTNAGGAGKWRPDHAHVLRGRRVAILPDNDDAGRRHAEQVAASLAGVAAAVRILHLPGLPKKGDVSDWLAAGGTARELLGIADSAPEYASTDARVVLDIDVGGWPPVEPFADPARPLFPLDALPQEMRQYVAELSTETQTPPDLAAMIALTVLSAAAGSAYHIIVRGDWTEPSNLYAAVALPPGERKTAVFARVRAPLDAIEKEEQARMQPLISAAAERAEINNQRLANLRKRAVNAKSAAEREALADEAVELKQRVDAAPAPVLPRLTGDDATTEIIAVRMAEQGGAFAVLSAEGGTLMAIAAGLYTGGTPNLDVLLKGHAGDRLAVDRMSRPSITVERPCLTIGISPQPNVLMEAGRVTQMRDRGMLARFLYALPDSRLGHWLMEPPVMSEAAARDWSHTVRRVFGLRPITGESGPMADTGDMPTPRRVCLSTAAGLALTAFREEIEAQLREGGDLEPLRDWASKLPGAVVRIGGLFHAMRADRRAAPWELELGVGDMERAITIAREYLIPHARAAFALMGRDDPTDSAARRIWRWASTLPADHFTTRDACRRFRDLKADMIKPALDELEERGYVRQLPDLHAGPRTGRRPSPTWEVRPDDADGPWDEGDTSDTTTSEKSSVRFVPFVPEDHTEIRPDGRGEAGDRTFDRDGVDSEEWIEL